jgi:hypothetical protein
MSDSPSPTPPIGFNEYGPEAALLHQAKTGQPMAGITLISPMAMAYIVRMHQITGCSTDRIMSEILDAGVVRLHRGDLTGPVSFVDHLRGKYGRPANQ